MNVSKKKKYEKIQVILTNRVRGLGNKGDVKYVAKGYFRNYLFPMGMAINYSEEKLNSIKLLKSNNTEQINWNVIIEKLENQLLFIGREASGNGVLYASIKSQDVAKIIADNFNIILEKSRIIITNNIKTLGLYKIQLDLDERIINISLIIGRSIEDAKKIAQEHQKVGENE